MPTQKPILNFAADEKLLKRINDFRFNNRIETRSEAIRILIEEGLKKTESQTYTTGQAKEKPIEYNEFGRRKRVVRVDSDKSKVEQKTKE